MAIYDPEEPNQAATDPDAFIQRFTDIQSDYIEKLPDKLEQINRLWNKLRFFNWSNDGLKMDITLPGDPGMQGILAIV